MLENVRDYEEKVFFIYLDKHVSCPCLHDRNISKNFFFFCVVQIPLALTW